MYAQQWRRILGTGFSNNIKNKWEYIHTNYNKNPQSNTIVEQLHQSISLMISIAIQENPPTNHADIVNLVLEKSVPQLIIQLEQQYTEFSNYHQENLHTEEMC